MLTTFLIALITLPFSFFGTLPETGYELVTFNSGAPLIDNNFLAPGGSEGAEAPNQIIATRNGKLVNLYVQLTVAPGAEATRTFTVRINGLNTPLKYTLNGSSLKGCDTTDSVPISASDLISVQVTESGKPASAVGIASFELAY
jgi:hypothetical protein